MIRSYANLFDPSKCKLLWSHDLTILVVCQIITHGTSTYPFVMSVANRNTSRESRSSIQT